MTQFLFYDFTLFFCCITFASLNIPYFLLLIENVKYPNSESHILKYV